MVQCCFGRCTRPWRRDGRELGGWPLAVYHGASSNSYGTAVGAHSNHIPQRVDLLDRVLDRRCVVTGMHFVRASCTDRSLSCSEVASVRISVPVAFSRCFAPCFRRPWTPIWCSLLSRAPRTCQLNSLLVPCGVCSYYCCALVCNSSRRQKRGKRGAGRWKAMGSKGQGGSGSR